MTDMALPRMLKSLKLGQKPTDCGDTNISTEVKVDHFVVAWREERAWRSQREASCLFPNSWKLWGLCPNKLWGGSQRFLAAPNPCGLLGAIGISHGLILQSLPVRRTGLKGLPVRSLHSKRGQPMLYGLSAAFCCDSTLLILLRAGSRLIRSLLGSVVERPSSVEPKGPGRKPGRKSIRQRPTLGLQSTPGFGPLQGNHQLDGFIVGIPFLIAYLSHQQVRDGRWPDAKSLALNSHDTAGGFFLLLLCVCQVTRQWPHLSQRCTR